jgi:erythronate-4-phosphate dehydrogenase
MKIVTDDKIPFIKGIFEPHTEVVYLPGGLITREHLLDADCLLVRTRTRCDQKLLEGTRVKFIGTATIGFDHIDTRWCNENGIIWTNAPGCNSGAVAQYITAVLHEMAQRNSFELKNKTLGIIGVGNVGKKVEKIARDLGMTVLLNDPPRERSEGKSAFTELSELLKSADIITIHVPLNREGQDKTINLVDRQFLETLKPGTILINSSRGEVIYEQAVLNRLNNDTPMPKLSLVLDVWPHEPEINRELLSLASIATPHIAGYSVEGKYNATRMIVESAAKFFNLIPGPLPALYNDALDEGKIRTTLEYDIMADDHRLRKSPETFEQQRNNYPQRWEYGTKK